MAYPLVKYNSSTGSDTNPSDCSASSVTASATASGSAGGTTITFSSSVNFTGTNGVADDDSDWMWCETTAGGIHLFRILSFTGGTSTCTSVTVEPPITANFSGAYWHVNGTRQSLNDDSTSAFGLDGNQWRRGWTVELDGTFEQPTGLNLCERESTAGTVGDPHFVLRASPSATTKPIVRSTATWARPIYLGDWISCYIQGIRFEVAYSGTTINSSAFVASLGTLTMVDCEMVHSGSGVGSLGAFMQSVNGVYRLFNCYIQPKTCSEVIRTGNSQQLILDNCHLDCESVGGSTEAIEGSCEMVVVLNTLISRGAGDGITLDLGNTFAINSYWLFKNNTIANCAGDGIDIKGTNTSTSTQPKFGLYIANNLLVGNGGWGIDLTDTSIERTANDVDFNAFYNNTSGTITGKTAGANDITLTADPFTDAANDDYSLNNTAGGGALVRDGARYVIPGT